MKKSSIVVVLFLILFSNLTFAQLAKDSWAFGFGFDYPRFVSTNNYPDNGDFGGYLSLQRNFTEHFGVRLTGLYARMISYWMPWNTPTQYTTTNSIIGDLDMMYYLVPCESVSPYVLAGVGGSYNMLTHAYNMGDNQGNFNSFAMQVRLGFGVEWSIDPAWKIVSEFGYNWAVNSELDGNVGPEGIGGHDAYMGVKVGALYYFSQGEPSKYCQLYTGIKDEAKDLTNYDRIEEMIKKNIPKEVIKEVVVEKASTASSDKWVLIGVNFAFNSSKLSGEAFPILYDAAKTLLKNPDVKVEIQGYCDYIGSDAYNKKLSQRRAETVKDYLESKGVASSRLTAVGYGKTDFVADNKTEDGRAANRRIEFKVQ
jgi:OOP family OmpA-OmpF porin